MNKEGIDALLTKAREGVELGFTAEKHGDLKEAVRLFRFANVINMQVWKMVGCPSETLSSLAAECEHIGDLEYELGNLLEAESCYLEGHALNLRLQEKMDGSPEVLRSLAYDFQRFGNLAFIKGDLTEAQRCYKKGHAFNLRLQAQLGDASEVIGSIAYDYICFGKLAFAWGNITEAECCYLKAHALLLRSQPQLGENPNIQFSLVDNYVNLGNVAWNRGQASEAKRCYQEARALNLYCQEKLGDSPDVMSSLARDLLNFGELAFEEGDVPEAERCFREAHALNLHCQKKLGDSPNVMISLARDFLNFGDLAFNEGDVREAERCYREAHALNQRRQKKLGDTPDVMSSLAADYLRLGDLAVEQEKMGEAEHWYRERFALNQRRQKKLGDTPAVTLSFARDFRFLGGLAQMRGEISEAISHHLTSASFILSCNNTGFGWTRKASLIGHDIANLPLNQYGLLADALPRLDHISEKLVEFLDLQSQDVADRSRTHFSVFHAKYLELALAHAPERIPMILSAIQGRKLAALVLDELESRVQEYPEGDVRRRFLEVRTELRRLALGLQLILGGRDEKDDRTSERSGRFELSHAAYRAQLARFEVKLEEYRQLRLELSRQPGFAVTTRRLEITCASLQAGLGEQEGLLLLLNLSPEPKDAKTSPAAYTLLMRRQGAPVLHALPKLSGAPAQMRDVDVALGRRGGYRDSATSSQAETSLVETGSAADAMNNLMQEALWASLAESLQGLNRLNVVTHGDLHAIPVSLGCPVECTTWPGLVFYHLHKTQPAPSDEDKRIGILGYSATATGHTSHAPIPFVDAESAMVQALWQKEKADNPLDFHQAAPVTCIHLAGHGTAAREHLDEAQLLIGPDRALTFHDVLGSPLRPQVVFLSACLVGQTREDLDGDPLGLVTAFMLRGARYIIAPLVPVSDFHMPLLAVLFHQSWLAGLPPHEALADAKRRLESGQWHEQTEVLVRSCYAPVLETHLPALYEGRYNPFLSPAMTVKEWFPDLSEEECKVLFDQGATGIIDRLVSNKSRLHLLAPVKEIINFTVGFGC